MRLADLTSSRAPTEDVSKADGFAIVMTTVAMALMKLSAHPPNVIQLSSFNVPKNTVLQQSGVAMVNLTVLMALTKR